MGTWKSGGSQGRLEGGAWLSGRGLRGEPITKGHSSLSPCGTDTLPVWWLVAECFQLSDVVAKETWTSLFKGYSHSWTYKEKVRLRVKDAEFEESYNLSAKELMLSNCGAGEGLRVPRTASRSNQSILKEINP